VRLVALVVVLTAGALALIAFAADGDADRRTAGVGVEVAFVTRDAPWEFADVLERMDGVHLEVVDDPATLADVDLDGRLLMIDGAVIDEISPGFLREQLRSNVPILAFNVPRERLLELTGFDEAPEALPNAEFERPPSRILEEPYLSHVYVYTRPEGGRWGGSGTGQLEGSGFAPGVLLELQVRKLGLIAKGLVLEPGNRVEPIESLLTPGPH
jgi:hypothetical protein